MSCHIGSLYCGFWSGITGADTGLTGTVSALVLTDRGKPRERSVPVTATLDPVARVVSDDGAGLRALLGALCHLGDRAGGISDNTEPAPTSRVG